MIANLVPLVTNLIETHGQRGAVAVIVSYRELEMWRQRISGLFDDVLEIAVFSNSGEAHQWLDGRASAGRS